MGPNPVGVCTRGRNLRQWDWCKQLLADRDGLLAARLTHEHTHNRLDTPLACLGVTRGTFSWLHWQVQDACGGCC